MSPHEIGDKTHHLAGDSGMETRVRCRRREQVGDVDQERRMDVGVRKESVQLGYILRLHIFSIQGHTVRHCTHFLADDGLGR